mgnify:FL=1
MRLRQAYEYALIECNKLKAPSILLEDFIYLFNKAIQQYVNTVYNRAEYNQQSSDDLGILQTTSIIEVDSNPRQEFNDTVWELDLPKDYLHLLNCVAEFKGTNLSSRCGDNITKVITSPCYRLTANLYPGIINNYYMRPSHKKPYYYIINRNENSEHKVLEGTNIVPTNYSMDNSIKECPEKKDFFLKDNYNRTSNRSDVKIEIHSGNSLWTLNKLYVTYIKSPMYVSMEQADLIAADDETQVLEFPDYVCYEIINIYVRLLLENASDPRLQTNVPINQTIAIPGNN